MRVFGLRWQLEHVVKHRPLDLPPKARDRLRALHLWQTTGHPALAAQTFQISRATLYRWRHAFDPTDPSSLRERSRRPHQVRAPEWSRGAGSRGAPRARAVSALGPREAHGPAAAGRPACQRQSKFPQAR
jgi:hypothetical protein